jgi:hypothetical protein
MGIMATTPAYTLAHVLLPNHTKLKGATTIVSALERKDKTWLAPVWQQAFITHDPKILTTTRDPYRIAVIDLPVPEEMGEAHFVGWVVKKSEPAFARFYALEHDYVLAKKANRTVLTERAGQEHKKYGDGPAVTGDFTTDATAFIDCFMELLVPTKVTRK